MAKRSTEWTTVREVVAVMDVPSTTKPGVLTPSLEVVLREQGQRMLYLRLTKKNARQLKSMLAEML